MSLYVMVLQPPAVLLLVLNFPKQWEDRAHVEDAHMAFFQIPSLL
jgi:hypothetical protein